MISADQNMAVVMRLVKDWSLGPTRTSVDKNANSAYWSKIAKVWGISEKEARRRFCANCEYFDNTVEKLAEMESIPINELDRDGGGRGWCHKFDFVCHNLRTCQAWEPKPFDGSEEESNDE